MLQALAIGFSAVYLAGASCFSSQGFAPVSVQTPTPTVTQSRDKGTLDDHLAKTMTIDGAYNRSVIGDLLISRYYVAAHSGPEQDMIVIVVNGRIMDLQPSETYDSLNKFIVQPFVGEDTGNIENAFLNLALPEWYTNRARAYDEIVTTVHVDGPQTFALPALVDRPDRIYPDDPFAAARILEEVSSQYKPYRATEFFDDDGHSAGYYIPNFHIKGERSPALRPGIRSAPRGTAYAEQLIADKSFFLPKQ